MIVDHWMALMNFLLHGTCVDTKYVWAWLRMRAFAQHAYTNPALSVQHGRFDGSHGPAECPREMLWNFGHAFSIEVVLDLSLHRWCLQHLFALAHA